MPRHEFGSWDTINGQGRALAPGATESPNLGGMGDGQVA